MMKPKRIEAVLRAVFSLTLFFAMVWPTLAQEKTAPLLVVISVDGLRPDYVTAPDAHGAKVPHLRKFLHEGTYSQGVTGVISTGTYPHHTTAMTGGGPAKQGILADHTVYPLQEKHEGS